MPSDPPKLSEVDDLVRGDHWHLRPEDACFFVREYTSHVGYWHSDTNDLISNLKKPVAKRANPAEWKYKGWAIRTAAAELAEAFARDWESEAGTVVVPAPCSKSKSHPEYDDRMVQVAAIVGQKLGLPVIELLESINDLVAQHTTGEKRNLVGQTNNLRVRKDLVSSPPQLVLIVDDVLVTGCTFRARKQVLQAAFPKVYVAGLYIARRRIHNEPPEDNDDDDY